LLSVGRAFGTIKQKVWNKFMDSLRDKKKKKIDVGQTIKEMKRFDLPIEEK